MRSREPFAKEFKEVADLVARSRRFLLLGHVDPDGDCIGSMLAIARFLLERGGEVACYSPGEIADAYRELPLADLFVRGPALERMCPDAIFALDSPTTARTDDLVRLNGGKAVVNIDHHPTNERYGTINIVDETASATSIVVYRLLSAVSPKSITPEVADDLYLGVLMDTGGFRFQNTNAEALAMAARFVELGARPFQLAHRFIYMKKLNTLRLLGRALGSIEVHGGGRIAFMGISRAMVAESGAAMADTEGFVDYAASIEDVVLGALFREVGAGEIRVSLRSRNGYDVATLAERHGGGGHRNAAGLTLAGDLASAKSVILAGFEEMLGAGPGAAG